METFKYMYVSDNIAIIKVDIQLNWCYIVSPEQGIYESIYCFRKHPIRSKIKWRFHDRWFWNRGRRNFNASHVTDYR